MTDTGPNRATRIREGLKALPKSIAHTTAGLFQCLGAPVSKNLAHKGFNNLTRGLQNFINAPVITTREALGSILSLKDGIIDRVLTGDNPTTWIGHLRHHTRDRTLHTLNGSVNALARIPLGVLDAAHTGINNGLDAAAGEGATGDGFSHQNGFRSTMRQIPGNIWTDLKRAFWTDGLLAKKPRAYDYGHFDNTQLLSATEADSIQRSNAQAASFQTTVPFAVIGGGKMQQATPALAQAA